MTEGFKILINLLVKAIELFQKGGINNLTIRFFWDNEHQAK
jgi:hypothetical protein